MPNRPPNDVDLLPTVLNRAEAIAARIGPTTARGCWLWVGAFTRNGYGTYTVSDPDWMYRHRSLRGHRAVFMLHHGRAIADGMTLHHMCEVRACVNPAHLIELSQDENIAASAWGGASIRRRPTVGGGVRWAVLFREAGKQRSRTFATEAEAEEFAESRKPRVA